MDSPPSLTGAVQETVASPFPEAAVTLVGAPGAVAWGVTDAVGDEAAEVPPFASVVTLNVYAVPLVSPVMVQWVALVDVQVPTACPAPLYAVTTYRVSVPPPRLVTAFHSKTTDPLPGVAVSPVGDAGSPYGVAATELLEPSPSDDDDAVTEKL